MAGDASTQYILLISTIFLFSGVAASLSNKTLFQKSFPAKCEEEHAFSKPYFMTMTMFIGEFMCLPVFYIMQYMERRKKKQGDVYQQLNDFDNTDPAQLSTLVTTTPGNQGGVIVAASPDPLAPPPQRPPVWFFYILSCFDLCATCCVNVAQQWISASVAQMLRGSMVVFTAIFSLMVLKRRYSVFQWGGIGIVVVGLIIVGVSTLLKGGDENSTTSKLIAGLLLTVLGSALNAIQNVVEEKLLKAANYTVHPLEVVGWEGLSGMINGSFILLPIVQHISGPRSGNCGVQEDTLDSLYMIAHSYEVVLLNLLYIFGLMALNWTANSLSLHLSATHRNLINTSRTVLVWIFSLILYYKVDRDVGENWNEYSLVQLAGFVLLIAGTFLYSWASQQASKKAAEAKALEEAMMDAEVHKQHVQN